VARAKVVAEKAPDLAEQVVAGEMARVRAERIVRDRQAEQKRKQAASEDAKRRKEAPRLDLRLGDFRDVLDDVRNVDAIITDPPYGREWLPLLADLADWADDALTDDGILAVLMGQAHLPGVYQRLDGRRPYRWTMCYRTPGSGTQMHHARLMTNWKPVLLYGNGPRIHDVITAEGSSEATRAHHEWGQDLPAFRELVSRLCRPGQTVADPFTGAGTTLIAARDYGCNVIGAELDPDHHATALRRLS
jgi:hypothetical protein